jgi:colicin import membrane protein
MSTLAFSYSEPYKLPAGLLALVVHAVFFAILYLGVNWHNDQPQGMEVEIWSALPVPQVETKVEPPPTMPAEPVKPIETQKLAEPVVQPKAEIELLVKKKPPVKLPEPVKVTDKTVQSKEIEQVKVDPKVLEAQAAQTAREVARAAQDAATNKVVGEYKDRIKAKIKRFIVMPPDVQDNAQAEFNVILIPGGSVMSTKLVKPSGSAAYDDAVDRAISKAEPLPVPPDLSLFGKFRELHLTFKPKE